MGSAREDAAATTAAPRGAVARSWSSCKETQRRLGEKHGARTRREPQQRPGVKLGAEQHREPQYPPGTGRAKIAERWRRERTAAQPRSSVGALGWRGHAAASVAGC